MARSAQVVNAILSGAAKQVGFSATLTVVTSDAFTHISCAGDPSELSPDAREKMRLMQAKRQFLAASKSIDHLIEHINPSVFDQINLEAIQEFDRQVSESRLAFYRDDYCKAKERKRNMMFFSSLSDAHRRIGRLEVYLKRMQERDMKLCAQNADLHDKAQFWRIQCDKAKVEKTTMQCRVNDLEGKLRQVNPPKRLVHYRNQVTDLKTLWSQNQNQ